MSIMRHPAAIFSSISPLSAAIALMGVLFLAAVLVFLSRDVAPLDLLRSTFSPGSRADYAFTLEQRVAPQRASVVHTAD